MVRWLCNISGYMGPRNLELLNLRRFFPSLFPYYSFSSPCFHIATRHDEKTKHVFIITQVDLGCYVNKRFCLVLLSLLKQISVAGNVWLYCSKKYIVVYSLPQTHSWVFIGSQWGFSDEWRRIGDKYIMLWNFWTKVPKTVQPCQPVGANFSRPVLIFGQGTQKNC